MDRSVLLIFQQAVSDIQIASSLLLSQHQPVKPPTTCLFERFSLLLPVRSSDKLKNSQEESPKKLATCINICCFCFKKKHHPQLINDTKPPKQLHALLFSGKIPSQGWPHTILASSLIPPPLNTHMSPINHESLKMGKLYIENHHVSSWRFQPIWKILVQLDHFPR